MHSSFIFCAFCAFSRLNWFFEVKWELESSWRAAGAFDHRLGAGGDVEFVVNAGDVGPDGADGKAEAVGDLLVKKALVSPQSLH